MRYFLLLCLLLFPANLYAAEVNLSWNHNGKLSDGRNLPSGEPAINFILYRAQATVDASGNIVAPSDAQFVQVQRDIPASPYKYKLPNADGVYYFRLKATRPSTGQQSAYSNEVSKDLTTPSPPEGFSGTIEVVFVNGQVRKIALVDPVLQ